MIWNCGTIDLDKRRPAAAAVGMDQIGDHLLTDAGGAGQQDRDLIFRDFGGSLYHILHHLALVNQLSGAV